MQVSLRLVAMRFYFFPLFALAGRYALCFSGCVLIVVRIVYGWSLWASFLGLYIGVCTDFLWLVVMRFVFWAVFFHCPFSVSSFGLFPLAGRCACRLSSCFLSADG